MDNISDSSWIICRDNPIFNLALLPLLLTANLFLYLPYEIYAEIRDLRPADSWSSFKSFLNSIKEFCLVEIIIESDFKFRFIGIDNDSNTGSICRNIKSFDQIPHPTLIRVPFDGSGLKATGLFSLVKTVHFQN